MQHTPPSPLAETFAAIRHSCAQLPPAQAFLAAMLLRLLASLESLARAWKPAPRPRRRYQGGKGPRPRDWMIAWHPTRKRRPLATPRRHARIPRARARDRPRTPQGTAHPDSVRPPSPRPQSAR